MTLADAKEIKQNEENNLLDFRLQGKQIELQSRPSPVCSRSSSRLDSTFRAMSATPTLSYQDKHRKTPPWTRPQSADHINRGSHRRKLAAKFDRNGERRHRRKGTGSMNNLLESSSIEDGLDSETSVTASPVPSLTEVLRSSGKLEPGLAGKPPIPPPPGRHKSLDDIINIKFQQWFPEAAHDSYSDHDAHFSHSKQLSNGYRTSNLKASKSSENLSDLRNATRTPETQVMLSYPIQFEAYESPRLDSNKKLLKSHTMETILESDDQSGHQDKMQLCSPEKYTSQNLNNTTNENGDFLKSKLGQSLNRYLEDSDKNNSKKKVTIHDNNGNKRNCIETKAEVHHSECTDSQNIESTNPEVVDGEEQISSSKIFDSRSEFNLENNRTGLNNEDILSWMGNSNLNGVQDKALGSTYNDILTMLRVLEKEEVESLKIEALSVNRSNNNSVCSNTTLAGTSCRDILTYLDDLDRTDSRNEMCQPEVKKVSISSETVKGGVGGRLGQLMNLDQAELAQRVMALSLELEGKLVECDRAQVQLKDVSDKLAKNKSQSDSIIKRHQVFIDQLLQEKRMLGEQCASIVKEMEEKHKKTLASMESRHEVELKKLQEKMLAAEKLKREKWENERIRKIKEQTVKGLEPELERLTRTHAEELSELRRAHDRELTELEAACSRRISSAREQSLRDRELAVQEEREAARKKLECELAEVERSYQEQRRRLLAEVREEKERLEREVQANLAVRARQLEEKWTQAEAQLYERLAASEEKHQNELSTLRETLEGERQSWLNHQVLSLAEKEKEIKEAVKKERDRHIEAVIRRLDQEALEKEKTLEAKMQRMKEEYERELKESEEAQHETKRKLKETRSEVQEYEELVSKLRTQMTQIDCQLTTAKQQIERLEYERSESRSLARSEACSQIAALQRELSEERLKREEALAALQSEKERELQQVYNRLKKQKNLTATLRMASLEMANVFDRVKEAISKKEETVRLVGKQRDAALEQCTHLENILEQQRKELTFRK